jgi:hypothetical protein
MELSRRFLYQATNFSADANSGSTEKMKLLMLREWWAKWLRRSRCKHPLSVTEMSREGLKDLSNLNIRSTKKTLVLEEYKVDVGNRTELLSL